MARSGPSRADEALIATLEAEGVSVSSFQLERWRSAGMIPRNSRRGLGRGRGSCSEVAPGAVEAVRLLARAARQGRASIWADTLVRFATGSELPEGDVRAAMLAELERWSQTLAASAGSDDAGSDARFAAAERFARRLGHPPDLELLIAAASGQDARPPPARSSRLAARVAAQVLAGGLDEMSEEEVVRASAVWLPLTDEDVEHLVEEVHDRQRMGAPSILGELPAATVSLLAHLASSASMEDLRRSLGATFKVTMYGQLLALLTVRVDIDESLFSDPAWQVNCRMVGLCSTRRSMRAALVLGGLANLERGDVWLEAMEHFGERAQAAVRDALSSLVGV